MRNSLFVLAVLLAVIWSGCQSRQMKRVSPTEQNTVAAIDRGLQFLLADQNPDGSFGKIYGATNYAYDFYMHTVASTFALKYSCSALACMALQQAKDLGYPVDAQLKKGVDYLLSLEPIGRADPMELASAWTASFVPRALLRCLKQPDLGFSEGRLKDAAAKWLNMLRRHQSLDGGFGYYDFGYGTQHPSGWDSTSFLTGSVLVTLKEAKDAGIPLPESMNRLAVECVQRLRLPNGAYIYGNYAHQWVGAGFNQVKGSLTRSQPANVGLFINNRLTEKGLKTGLDNLIKHHHFIEIARGRPYPHETWYANAPYYFYFGHYYAAEAVKLLPHDEQAHYWKHLKQWMLDDQQADGSWWDWRVMGFAKIYGTSYGLMILMSARQYEIN